MSLTTKPVHHITEPRILQSADEAPCGCLLQDRDGDITMRLPNGDGRHMGARPGRDEGSGPWDARGIASLVYAPIKVIAEGLTEAECHHLSGLSAAAAIAWCEQRDKDADLRARVAAYEASGPFVSNPKIPTPLRDLGAHMPAPAAKPQSGDVVPWAEVEDGCLYHRSGGYPFRMAVRGRACMMIGPDDIDIERFLDGCYLGIAPSEIEERPGVLVARNLGTDPETWRRAMREWTANGNKPAAPVTPLAAAVADIDATAEVSESPAWAKVKAATVDINAYMHNIHRALMVAEDNRDTARKERDQWHTLALELQAHAAEQEAARMDLKQERDEARAGWAEQTADAARLRLALQDAQQRLTQAHEDIDALIAKQTAADRELFQTRQETAHRGRIVGRLLDEMTRGYFVDRFLDSSLYADAMKAAGRAVKP